jgi:hypothetical protein
MKNVEIGAEAAQFPEKEYIDGIALAVCRALPPWGLRREVGLTSDGGRTDLGWRSGWHGMTAVQRTRRCERPSTDDSESFGPVGLLGKELITTPSPLY